MSRNDSLLAAVFWSGLTIALYVLGKVLYRRKPRVWTSPLILPPVLLILTALSLHVEYREYIGGTRWLVTLLGPATVAFAVPIYEQQKLIRRQWFLLIVATLVGSAVAILSSWGLAVLFRLDDSLRRSLLPRSFSMPFALPVSADIGGVPALTALFVLITGVTGAAVGELLLCWLPLRSVLARGALFGMGAHAIGAAKAHQLDPEVGPIAGLVMVLVGLFNVLTAPLLASLLR
jgi:predicted murein hydrolase (TIGR00659 family)